MNDQLSNQHEQVYSPTDKGDFDASQSHKQIVSSESLGRLAAMNHVYKGEASLAKDSGNSYVQIHEAIADAEKIRRYGEGLTVATSIIDQECNQDDVRRLVETIDYFRADASGLKQGIVIEEEDTGATVRFTKDIATVSVGGTTAIEFPSQLLRDSLTGWLEVISDEKAAEPALTLGEYGAQIGAELTKSSSIVNELPPASKFYQDINTDKNYF